MRLSELTQPLQATLHGEDVSFNQISTDTRLLKAGELFVALKGERFNAEEFVTQAQHKGAVAVVLDERLPSSISQLIVEDTRLALGQIAALNRQNFLGSVIGLTGSVGKTTCKEMLSSILSQKGNTLATQGNLNNEIGVPLTLLNIGAEHDYAVVEMGAAQVGDIEYLTQLVKPNVALVTTVEAAHLGRFGSMENIAATKQEIFNGLVDSGIAVVNIDNEFTQHWASSFELEKVITFSVHNVEADVYATDIQVEKTDDLGQPACYSYNLHYKNQQARVKLTVPGKHMVLNSLACAASAFALLFDIQMVAAGIKAFTSVSQRMQIRSGLHGARVIDDTYNANPASMRAAIDVLASLASPRIFVMGEMGELGELANELHADIGRYALECGIEYFVGVGQLCSHATKAYGVQAQQFSDREQASQYCRDLIVEKNLAEKNRVVNLLVKGSRFTGMEKLVDSLLLSEGAL